MVSLSHAIYFSLFSSRLRSSRSLLASSSSFSLALSLSAVLRSNSSRLDLSTGRGGLGALWLGLAAIVLNIPPKSLLFRALSSGFGREDGRGAAGSGRDEVGYWWLRLVLGD